MTNLTRKKNFFEFFKIATDSNAFLLLEGALVLFAHFWANDVVSFYIIGGVEFLLLMLSDDARSAATLAFMAYASISLENGPSGSGKYDYAYYSSPEMMTMYFTVGGALAAAFVFRFVASAVKKGFFKRKPSVSLASGMALITVGLLTNGLDFYKKYLEIEGWTTSYTVTNLYVGVLEAAVWFGFFYVLLASVDWENDGVGYLQKAVFVAALVVAVEFCFRIVQQAKAEVLFFADGSINRAVLDLGWGVSNNVGAYLSLGIPAAIYLAATRKRGWLYYVAAWLLFGCVLFTECRTALVSSAVVLGVGTFAVLITAKDKKGIAVCVAVFAAMAMLLFSLFDEPFKLIFARLFDDKLYDSGRFTLWQRGLQAFALSPIFGAGFLADVGLSNNTVFHNMYHNEIIQILAATGIVGFFGFAVHKFQVWRAVFQKMSVTRLFLGLGLLNVTLLSMFDNNWFLPFVGFVYAALLACVVFDANKSKFSNHLFQIEVSD